MAVLGNSTKDPPVRVQERVDYGAFVSTGANYTPVAAVHQAALAFKPRKHRRVFGKVGLRSQVRRLARRNSGTRLHRWRPTNTGPRDGHGDSDAQCLTKVGQTHVTTDDK